MSLLERSDAGCAVLLISDDLADAIYQLYPKP